MQSGRTPIPKARQRKIASGPVSSSLFKADLEEIERLCASSNRTRADIIRDLVHEAIRARRLRQIGRDETTIRVRDAQREMLVAELAPIKALLEENAKMRKRHGAILESVHDGITALLNVVRIVLREALRASHLLWSTVEAQASENTLDLKGRTLADLKETQDRYWDEEATQIVDQIREDLASTRP